jgi:DNA ligase (NAD+)
MIGEDYYPQNVSAFKVNSEAIPATVLSVEWGVGRTGKLTPVVHITPTDINGATVSKATGFNARFIELNTIAQGAVIGIQRSGDVIPNITECILVPTNTTEFLPNNCPYCNTPLEFSKTGIDLYCPNEYCTEKMIYVIENFLLSYGCEEITSTTLKNLNITFNSDLFTAISELFSLTVPDIMKIEGFGESRANQIVTEIRKCLNTTPDKMLKSFGISGIGNTISKTLTNLYSMDELFTMPAEKFVDIEGMGLVLSNNLVDGLRKNLPLYLFLLTRGLEFKELDSNKFKGKSFTLTGKSTMKRDDIVNFIESNGGMVKSISKTTSYLVTNDPNSSSSKTKKAREYGTKIISYDELMNF